MLLPDKVVWCFSVIVCVCVCINYKGKYERRGHNIDERGSIRA